MELKPLTRHQIFVLTSGKKHWSKKKKFLLERILSFGNKITEDDLQYFMEDYIPSEEKRIRVDYFRKSQTGEKITKFTPTDVDGSFSVPDKPIIGKRYHISWAFKGAQFILKKVEGDYAYLDNPRNKRATLLKCKVSELRNLRGKDDNYKYH
jgi:Asp-tRNA(Asn)/Glu-tRNA(Gln) amidotransferase C subunit